MMKIARLFFWTLICTFFQQFLCAQNRTIDSLLLVLKVSIEDTVKVNTLNKLAEQYRANNELTRASEIGEQSLLLAGHLNFKQGKATALGLLGLTEQTKGNTQKAIQNFQAAIVINEEMGNKTGAAMCMSNIGNSYFGQGKLSEALKYQKSALKIQEETGNKQGQMRTNINLGAVYGSQGNYPEALKNFFIALKLGREIGDKNIIANSLRNIATCYSYEGNWPEALKYNKESLKLMEEMGNKLGIANSLTGIAVNYEKQDKHDLALQTFTECLKIYEKIGDKYKIGETLNYLGIIYSAKNEYDEALKHHKAAFKIKEELGDKWGLADAYVNIGKVKARMAALSEPSKAKAHYDEALQYVNKGMVLIKEVGAKESEQGTYKILLDIYTAIGDYKNALEYNKFWVALKDSLMNNETTRKLEQLRTDFEVEKAVEQEKLQQERTLAEQKFKNEKELAEKNAKHVLELAEERLKKEKAIEIEKLKYDFALAEEKSEQEKLFAAQGFENERKLTDEAAKHQQAITDEKARQEIKDAEANALLEKEKAAKQRRTEGYIAGLIGLTLILIFTIIVIRQRNQKRRAVEKAEAGHKMAELELQSLRAQLNPHFMFNSLNAIQDLILKEDNDKSHLYLSRFSKLLRMLLDNADQPFVTVKQELELLELYLSLENLRIPNLQYSIEKDPKLNAEDRMIPNMMLQPYIENAIWHGLSNKKGERKLEIRIHENGNATEFEVEDNGIGRKRSDELKQQFRHGHHSKGMQLLSKRFELLSKEYGSSIQTTITDLENNGNAAGTLVKIDVPFNLSEQAKRLIHDTNYHN